MIIAKIQGGLGNQMFQYAAGLAIAKKYNVKLKLDISNFVKDQIFKREYLLDKFNIEAGLINLGEVTWLQKKSLLYRIADKLSPIHRRKIIVEQPFEFYNDFDKIGSNAYMDGYWQSEEYFKNYTNDIKRSFVLKNVSPDLSRVVHEVSKINSVSVHVRRADYVTLDFVNNRYGVCPISYYKSAVQEIAKKVDVDHYYIFSDDVEWVKKNIKLNRPCTFISGSGLKDYEEIVIMSKCKHNIIANSSFSWWGAWLNENPNKIVCAPKKWLKTNAFDASYILPEKWIKL